jgi:hypothetical protein
VESEVAAAVDLHNLKDALDVLRDLPQSETAKAMLAMRAYETLGIVQAEGATAADLPEGASKPADRAVVLRELQDNAQTSARQAQLAADFFGNGAPGGGQQPQAAPPMDGTTPDPNAPAQGGRMAHDPGGARRRGAVLRARPRRRRQLRPDPAATGCTATRHDP